MRRRDRCGRRLNGHWRRCGRQWRGLNRVGPRRGRGLGGWRGLGWRWRWGGLAFGGRGRRGGRGSGTFGRSRARAARRASRTFDGRGRSRSGCLRHRRPGHGLRGGAGRRSRGGSLLHHLQHGLNGPGPFGGGQVRVGVDARDDAVHESRVEARPARVRFPEAEHLGQPADDGSVEAAVFDFEIENLFEVLQGRVHAGDCTRKRRKEGGGGTKERR